MGETSLMSFRKVPCTPITGVHVNFYDVFGDVERIGTGSSCASTSSLCSGNGIEEQLQLEGKTERERNGNPHYCRKCKTDILGPLELDPYILFLQEKQEEILSAFHDEIRLLKQENSDLKFQVHVILCQQQQPRLQNDSLKCKDRSSTAPVGEKEVQLKRELESAKKMIEELKWIHQHYEKKIKMQEDIIEDLFLRKQSVRSPATPHDYLYRTAPASPHSRTGSPESKIKNRQKSGHRQLQNPTPVNQNGIASRRNSLQSLLPKNYKEQVATLPPIINCDALNNSSSHTRTISASNSKLKQNYGQSAGKSRKSIILPNSLSPNISRNSNSFYEDSKEEQDNNSDAQY